MIGSSSLSKPGSTHENTIQLLVETPEGRIEAVADGKEVAFEGTINRGIVLPLRPLGDQV